MERNKKIMISLVISMVLVLIINIVFSSKINSQYVEVPVFKSNKLRGSSISDEDIIIIKVKKEQENENLLSNLQFINEIDDYILNKDVMSGEMLSAAIVDKKEESLIKTENCEYVVIPVSNSSNITCNKLKLGDKITVYYTAKLKDVHRVIKDKNKIHSNNNDDGLVTCKLFENIEFISSYNSVGGEANNNVITDILVRLENKEAMTVINLKQLGTFDVVLN